MKIDEKLLARQQGYHDYKAGLICNPFYDRILQEEWTKGYLIAKEEDRQERKNKQR